MKAKMISASGLSKSQEIALVKFKEWFEDNKSLMFTLSGSAGTGKSYLINYIIDTIIKSNRLSYIISAPTHKATRVIERFTGSKGTTIHSLLGLRPNFNLNNFNLNSIKFESLGSDKFNKYNIIIMDESSMISKDLYKLISIRSIQYNTRVIFIGDKLQLLPVKELTISEAFNNKYNYNLTDIIRQNINNPLIKLLTLLRNDIPNDGSSFLNYIKQNKYEFNDIHGYRVYDIKAFNNYIIDSFTSDEFKSDINSYRIGTYTNDSVTMWNKVVRSKLINSENIIEVGDKLMGYKTIVDEYLTPIIINSNDYIVRDVYSKMSDDKFKVYNLILEDLDSGFQYSIYIADHKDDSFINYYNKLCELHRNAIYADTISRGAMWKTYYHYKETFLTMIDFDLVYDGRKHAKVTRELDYSYAVTIHKLQGSTIKNIIIDAINISYYRNNKRMPRVNRPNDKGIISNRNRLLYTGLSRASETANILYF